MQLPNRLKLVQTLSGLPAAQFQHLVFALNPPRGILPLDSAQGKVAAVLLDWVETTGPGLVALEQTLNQVLGIESPPQTAICPYRGLSYFDCNDTDYQYFYGREGLTQTLLAKVAQNNFLAIVGASGSGKSSVLRAGLLQRLRDRGDTEIRILVPGEHPLQSLGLAFVDEALERTDRAKQLQNVEDLMQQGAKGLASLVKTSLAERVVLVVDQFEEAFTLCHDTAERQAFFATLLGGLDAAPGRLGLILAMRSDFVGKCFEQHYSGLAQQVERHLTAVLPMTPAELTEAIAAPARQTGLSLEPGLVEALLKDVDPTSGSLPLLQYTLTELWQRRQENQLKLSTYHQLEGVTGTLRQRADAVYDALSPEQQQTARHIFLSLTQLGEGAEDTRRRITQDSLVSAQHPEPQVVAVVKRLADANLVVTDERAIGTQGQRTATVDVAHEALIRNWPRLRQWLDENRDLLRQQRKIEVAAKEWRHQPKKRQNAYLLQGRQLSDARAFQKRYDSELPLSQQAEKYLAESLTHQRNNRLKTTFAGLVIPLALASYTGVQTAAYFRLRPHWDLINSYDAENNKVANAQLTRALREISSTNRSLQGIYLPASDLSSANLSEVNLSSANLSFANLNSANLTSASLSFANLSFANLSSANLTSANLSEVNLTSANLTSANLTSADLSSADLRTAALRTADFRSTNLRSANLSSTDLRSTNLRSANLSSADLSSANLSSADLSFTDLSFTDLSSTDLRSADLRSADLSSVDLSFANLSFADLSFTELSSADLRSANLSSADLRSANLRFAGLSSADLSSADLSSADLTYADLRSADLNNTSFLSTNLRHTRGLGEQQLMGEEAPLFCNSLLPDSINIEGGKDRDCDKLPAILQERHPNEFKTIKEAEAYVEEQRNKVW